MIDLFTENWPYLVGVCGVVGACVKFWLDSLRIKEAKLKIRQLEDSLSERNSMIHRPTSEEIEKYSQPQWRNPVESHPMLNVLPYIVVPTALVWGLLNYKHQYEMEQVTSALNLTEEINDNFRLEAAESGRELALIKESLTDVVEIAGQLKEPRILVDLAGDREMDSRELSQRLEELGLTLKDISLQIELTVKSACPTCE